MSDKPKIGIDLGTTNSCVAVYRNNRVDIIANEMGSRTTPSCVTFTDDCILTGPEAAAEAYKYPKSAIFETKRLIGQNFLDEKVQKDIQGFPFDVFNDYGTPKIRINNTNGETHVYYPEEISSFVIQRMKKIAETFTKETIDCAVVTVPAYFNDAQRQGTKDAAVMAGFKTVSIINEPTAAALAFDHDNKIKLKKNILVYDFGGGTFDVSIVTVGGSECKVLATKGDSHLGGTDIDSIIVEYLQQDYKKRFGQDLNCDYVISRRLKNKSESAKIALSGNGRFHYDIEIDFTDKVSYSSAITRVRLEHLSATLFNKTIDCVDKCLKECNLQKEDIAEVVLVGGSSRIPKIQSLIKAYFGEEKINQTINADEAVAYGAAVYAAHRGGADKADIAYVTDVTSLSIGTNVENDEMSIIISKNTPLPAEGCRTYQTVYDNQSTMDFPIFQGESIAASENVCLGQFTLNGLTEAPAKSVRVTITCRIDSDGILNISAKESNCTNTKNVVIDAKKYGLSEEKIKAHIREAEINNERTRSRQKFETEKYHLETSLVNILEYAKQPNIDNKDDIVNKYDEICKWLETAKIADVNKIIEFNNEIKELRH